MIELNNQAACRDRQVGKRDTALTVAAKALCTCIVYMLIPDHFTCMTKPDPKPPKSLREPAQVHLASDDSDLLARLSVDTGLSKAEVLRRGIRSFAREQSGANSPMLSFVAESSAGVWPENVAAKHDDVLAESYRPASKKKR